MFTSSVSSAQEFSATTIGDYGNVTVMEVTGNYDADKPDGTVNSSPREAISKEFFNLHKDEYDFLVIFSNFNFQMPAGGARAFYMGVRNDTQGIGLDIFDNSSFFGSQGKLQGTIDMGNIANLGMDPLEPKFEETLYVLSHELMHRWGAFVKFRDVYGNTSSALLGKDNAHWSFLLDSGGSVLYGNTWTDNGNGTFTSTTRQDEMRFYSPLDLYLMGIYDRTKVSPMLLIESPGTDPAKQPMAGITIPGTARTVTIDDIIAAMGERVPSASASQKSFKTAFIFITAPGTFTGNELYGIESVRKAWATRLSIVTDGAALIHIDATPDETIPTNPGVAAPVTTPRPTPANVDEGIEWLKNNQRADGSWMKLPQTAVRDTTEALFALQRSQTGQQNYELGLQWISAISAANVDYLSRQILVRAPAGQSVQSLIAALVQRQNADGGWGGSGIYRSTATDTALALQALQSARYADTTVLSRAVDCLVALQNADGGWGFGPGNDSYSSSTALVMQALQRVPGIANSASALTRATQFLLAHQNADGGFGSSPSTVYETALAFMALRNAAIDGAVFDKAAAYLKSRQGLNGSWNDDPYSTSLALQSLISVKPNLVVNSSGISHTPSAATVNESVTVTAIVSNTGLGDAANIPVSFYDGDPAAAGLLIGESVIAAVSAGGTATASVSWTPAASGIHTIFVVVDQAGTLSETATSDNVASAGIRIYEKTDLTVQEIVFSPALPSPGQAVSVLVKVLNRGGMPAQNFILRLSVDGAALPDRTIDSINSLQTKSLTFTLQGPVAGVHEIRATVDPADGITESDETNNTLTKTFEVKERIDLIASPTGIHVSNSSPGEGETVYFAAVIYNARESSATNLVVRLYDGDPAAGGSQIGGDQIIATISGGMTGATGWVPYATTGKAGRHTIYVVADPLNALEETDEVNNIAITTFSVTGRADLLIQDIQFTPSSAEEGDSVQIRAVFKNNGSAQSASGKLVFYLGNPAAGGQQIGLPISTYALNPGAATTSGAITFNTADHQGANGIYAVIDTTNTTDEINETNNSFNKTLTVQASSRPDFTVSAADISFDPVQPAAGGTVSITALVRNMRDTAAVNVSVNYYDGDPAAGGVLLGGTVIPALPGMGSAPATFSWNLTGVTGKHTVYVKADPAGAIAETNESNNTGSSAVKIRLPQAAAPVNLTATPIVTSVDLAWETGPESATYGVASYNIYRNGVRANAPRNIALEGTATASSSYSSSYGPGKATDGDNNTYWHTNYNPPLPVWWSESFATPRRIKKAVIYWYDAYYSARNFTIQTWNGAEWVTQSSITNNGSNVTVHEFYSSATTTAVRMYATAGNSSYFIIREVKLYEETDQGATAYQDAGLGAGNYTYYVTAVDSDGVESVPSNTAIASLGDTTPPAAPTGMSATASGFNVNTSWNANSETDLAGYRVYRSGLNVAQRERGAWITATNGSYAESVIDGSTGNNGYMQWDTSPAGAMTIALAREYNITKLRMLLYNGNDSRFYRYLIESSLDGKTWTTVSDKRAGEWRDWQETVFAQPVQARYFRITGTFCSAESYFRINEFEAYTSELAPKTLDSYGSLGLSVNNYSNAYEWAYNWNSGSKQPRKFVFSQFNIEEKDVLAIYDRDTNLLLAAYTGNRGTFTSPPLTASNYRFQFIADSEGTAPGFTIAGYLTPGKQTWRSFSETVYQNGSYSYASTAVDTAGNESGLSNVAVATIADTAPPAVPGNLAATAGNGFVNLTWSSNWESDFAGYNLYRNNDPAPVNGTQLLTTTSYKDTSVSNLSTYAYRLAAVDVNGNESSKTTQTTATPTGIDLSIYQSGTSVDLFLFPKNPTIYETATITALVKNAGTDTIGNIKVNFYDGNPSAGGTLIGSTVIQNSVGRNETAIGQVVWDLRTAEGAHTVYAVVDPDNTIPELLETNNKVFKQFTVTTNPILTVEVNTVNGNGFPAVEAKVRVRDANDNGVFGLNENNFTLTENGLTAAPITVTALTDPQKRIPKVDAVFVIDTSGSMSEEWVTICGVIDDIVDLLLAQGIDLSYTIYGLQHQYTTGDCSTVLSQVIYNNSIKSAFEEDWGPGTTWAAKMYPWREGAARIIIPISDENAYAGEPETQEDVNSIQEAIQASVANQAIVYPFYSYVSGSTIYPKVREEAEALAAGTGGLAILFQDANQVINEIIKAAKRSVSDYLITYTTPNPARDGTVRHVTVDAVYSIASGTGSGQYTAPTDALPDLTVGTLTFSSDLPNAGDTVVVSAEIENLGGQGARDILVRFFDGDPAYGVQIGSDQRITALPPAGKTVLSVNWTAVPGVRSISAVVDPLNEITESREDNNKATASIYVPGRAMPELGIRENDIVLSQPVPNRGETVDIQATVHNTGSGAQNVLVLFYLGEPANGGTLIGSAEIADLPGNSVSTVTIPWPVDKPAGTYTIHVWIDPYNDIAEGNEADNRAFRSVTTGEKTIVISVATDKPEYPAASDADITAVIRNDTAVPWSGSATLLIEDQDGNRAATVTTVPVQDLKPAGLGQWAYRIPASITADRVMRDVLAETTIDFAQVFASMGLTGKTIDQNSIRVLELGAAGNIVGQKKAKGVFATADIAKVAWLVDGQTAAGTTRYFSLYFDTTDHGSKTPSTDTGLSGGTGKLIAFSDYVGKISAVESNNNGTFSAPRLIEDITTSYDYTWGILMQDFNNDGFVDIVTGVGTTGDIYLYRNKADGTDTFALKVKIGTISASGYVMDFASADFNNDGNMDFVVSGNAYSQLYLFKGNGDGTFVQSNLTAPSAGCYFRGKTAADVDGDGNADLIVGTDSGVVYLYKGKGDGTFQSPVQLANTAGGESYGVVTGDFDMDGKVDILVNKGGTGDTYLLKGNGNGTFSPAALVPSLDTNTYSTFDAGDFNSDGLPDIVAGNYSGSIEFYPGRGDGTFGTKAMLASGYSYPLGISASPIVPKVQPVVSNPETVPARTITAVWNTGTTPSGNYKVHALLSESGGTVTEASAPFAILPDIKLASRVTTNKASYLPQEPVEIASSVTNLGLNAVADQLAATITIRDSQGTQVFTEARSLTAAAPGQVIQFTSFWNTRTNPKGTYSVTLEATRAATIATTASAFFDIVGSADTGAGLTGAITARPNPVYQGNNETLTYSVTNTGNEDITNLRVKIYIIDPDTREVKNSLESTIDVAMSATFSGQFVFSTSNLSAKTYLAVLQASTVAMTQDITLAGTTFAVKAPLTTLKGLISAGAKPVCLGRDQVLSYSITNVGETNISNANVLVTVIDPETKEVKNTFQSVVSIHGSATVSGIFNFPTAGITPKSYIVELQVSLPEMAQTKTLASDTFDVQLCIDVTKTIRDVQRVLVWLNYAWDTGQDCPDRPVIEQALKDAGVSYHIVLEKKDFDRELRNPWYTDIMVLGTSNPIEDHISEELREHVNNGKGLIASLFYRQNLDQDVLGINYINSLPSRNYPVELAAGDLWSTGLFQAHGKALDVEALNSGEIAGWIVETTNKETVRHPAVIKHDYGLGKVLYYAFDLALSTENYGAFASMVEKSLQHVHRAEGAGPFGPGKWIPVEVTLKSHGAEFDVRLTEKYPVGVTLYDASSGQWITDNPWSTELHVGRNETKSVLYYAVTPDDAGSYTLETAVEYLEAGTYRHLEDLSVDIAVAKTAVQITGDIIATLQALSVTGQDAVKVESSLKFMLNVQNRPVTAGNDVDKNIHDIVAAIDSLLTVTTADFSDIRVMMDTLLEIWESRWYSSL